MRFILFAAALMVFSALAGPVRAAVSGEVLSVDEEHRLVTLSYASKRKWKKNEVTCITLQNLQRRCGMVVKSTANTLTIQLSESLAPEKPEPTKIAAPAKPPPTVAREAAAEIAVKRSAESPEALTLFLGLGLSSDGFTESDHADYLAIGISPEARLSYAIAPAFGVTAAGSMTALSILKDQSPTLRLIKLDLDVGYKILTLPLFTLTLSAGGFYRTMFVSGNAFGFRDLSGALLFPQAAYTLSETMQLSGYVKVSPILSGGSFGLANRELALGASFLYGLANSAKFVAALEFTDLKFGNSLQSGELRSFAVVGGYQW